MGNVILLKTTFVSAGSFSETTFLATPVHSLSSPSSPLDGPFFLLPAFSYILTATPPSKVPAAIVSQPQLLVANHVRVPIDQLDKGKGSF